MRAAVFRCLLVSFGVVACGSSDDSAAPGPSEATGGGAGGGAAGSGGTTGVGGSDAGKDGATAAGGSDAGQGGKDATTTIVGSIVPGDAGAGVWQPMLNWPLATHTISGEGMLVDPVRPSDYYFFYEDTQPNGYPRHVLKSTDYGLTWTQIDKTAVKGNPWGVAIDPNPSRDPNTPPTMFTPAGYGDGGMWKSTDGGVTWTNLFANAPDGTVPKTGGGTVTFPPDKNNGHHDYYQAHILPDDPPNHLLITYHYGQPGSIMLGESKDGGTSWEVHNVPWGDSHYVYGVDASTWLLISGSGSGGGLYRTTTAGRVGGAISEAAWTKVDAMEHVHGSFTPWIDSAHGYVYFGGTGGIKRTHDGGATWTVAYNMPSWDHMSTLVGTGSYGYGSDLSITSIVRTPIADGVTWTPITAPAGWWGGSPPYGVASSTDGKKWVIVQAQYGQCNNNCQPPGSPLLDNGEIWRYVEP